MKRGILLLICILFISSLVNSQYRINKKKYDYHSYTHQKDDLYHPAVAGGASVLIPGLGQMLSGEFLRGIAFTGGCIVIFWGSLYIAKGINESPTYNNKDFSPLLIMTLGVVGWVFIDIWSTVDAVRVAKVNNLSFASDFRPLA